MDHILIIIGFCFLLFLLSENKENFSQLILPDYDNAIFTGKTHFKDKPVIVKADISRKPSPIEDVKQPPYARFSGGDDKISDSPEDIKEIDSRLEEILTELDIFADTKINLGYSELNHQAICGEEDKKLSPADFKTPWRKGVDVRDNKTMKLFERYIIQKFAPKDCLWAYSGDSGDSGDSVGNSGCGILEGECRDIYGRGLPGDGNQGDEWMNSQGGTSRSATASLILNCTGYQPEGDDGGDSEDDEDEIIVPDPICKRLCCNNLLFPMSPSPGGSITSEDRKIYKKYLKYLHVKSQENDTMVPYIESSLDGIYKDDSF